MCLGAKYPEAIPLKQVDALTVADSMVEIFSRIGIPAEILTDQGYVFMGKVTWELCRMLAINHFKTSPYHPQIDGCLERWHGSLKNMLRKCEERKTEWDKILKYFLFAYRNTPYSNAGFSPFEVVFGPLKVLNDGWMTGDVAQFSVVDV